jgi:gluconokinase
MGVSGAGKTEVGRRLAAALGWTFRDADDFHPAANVAKMRSGVPLTDDDRRPWLDALAVALREAVDGGGDVVLACSALARRYRDRLGLPHPLIRLVHLDDPSGVVKKRVEGRGGARKTAFGAGGRPIYAGHAARQPIGVVGETRSG